MMMKRLILAIALSSCAGAALAMPPIDAAYVTVNPRNKVYTDAVKMQAALDTFNTLSIIEKQTLLNPVASKILLGAAPVTPAPNPTPTPTPVPTPSPTPTPTLPVTSGKAIANEAALASALASARGGETFLLAPGGYSFKLANKSYSAPVTLTSANPANPAVIGFSTLTNVRNMAFVRLAAGRATANENEWFVKIIGGSDFTFDTVHFRGSMDNNSANDGVGLQSSADNVTIKNSEFEQVARGGQISGSNINILNNRVHNMRTDGFMISSVHGIVIDGNIFSGIERVAGDHPDAVQFLTNGQSASYDIVIRNNVVIADNGVGMQGFFLRDEMGGMPYVNVTIENNFVLGTNMANGITVAHGQNVTVRNNTVISPTDDGNPVWIRYTGSDTKGNPTGVTGLVASGNIADSGGQFTPQQAFSAAQLGLLKTSNLARLRPEQFVVPGKGYQP